MPDRPKLIQINGVWVPQTPAVKIGLGCPKCDRAEIVPTRQREHDVSKICSGFVRDHRDHGPIETIEVQIHGGREEVIVTGFLPLQKSAVLQ
jgi:hypothetical protein